MYLDFDPGTRVEYTPTGRRGTVLEVSDDHYIVGLYSLHPAGEEVGHMVIDAWPGEVRRAEVSQYDIERAADAITGSMLPRIAARGVAEAVLRAASQW